MRQAFSAIAALLLTATLSAAAPVRIEPIKAISAREEIRQTISEPTIYAFTGRAGQRITASLWAGSLSAQVFTPSGQELATLERELEQKVLTLPESGLYRVKVKPLRETTAFVLEFESANSGSSFTRDRDWEFQQPQRLVLKQGQSTVNVRLTLGKQEIQPLTIAAKAGQRLSVKAEGVDLAIESPSGQLLDQGNGETVATLPESGVYRVLVIAKPSTVTSVNVELR